MAATQEEGHMQEVRQEQTTTAPPAAALPCATSNAADVWETTHQRLKAESWDDPALVRPGGVQRVGELAWDVGHCRGCHSTIYRERTAEAA